MNNISIIRGNDKTLELHVKDEDGKAYNLAGCQLDMYVKKQITDADGDAVIHKSSTVVTQIKITDASGGIAEIYIDPTDTLKISGVGTTLECKRHYYDIELKTATPEYFTIVRDVFEIDHE